MSEVININGDQYTEDDFNDEQKYLLRQIRSCKARVEQLTFGSSKGFWAGIFTTVYGFCWSLED